jgi:hypothetical protein
MRLSILSATTRGEPSKRPIASGPPFDLDADAVPMIPETFGPELAPGLPFATTRLSISKLAQLAQRLSDPLAQVHPEPDPCSVIGWEPPAGADPIDIDLAWVLPRLARDLLATELCDGADDLLLDE